MLLSKLNTYLVNKFNIPAFQHRIIHRLSFFSFKMLNFVSAPKNLKEVFLKNLEEKSLTEKLVSVDFVDAQIEPVYLKIQGHIEMAKHLCQNLKLSQNII